MSVFINKFNYNNIKILDLGSGERTHAKKTQERLNCKNIIYGFDYSKDAIKMATDYSTCGNIYFVGDVNNIPIVNNQIDFIIDFLSPFNAIEINRVLKDEGYILKISPGENYLKELRTILNMETYEKKEIVKENILKKFNIIEEKEISKTFKISEKDLDYLINMTPVSLDKNGMTNKKIESITIDMVVYILKRKRKS